MLTQSSAFTTAAPTASVASAVDGVSSGNAAAVSVPAVNASSVCSCDGTAVPSSPSEKASASVSEVPVSEVSSVTFTSSASVCVATAGAVSGEVNAAAPASLTVAIVIIRLNVTATNLLFTIMSSFFIHATL